MSETELFVAIMETIAPVLRVSGWLALTISLIVMLVNMIINAATGKGFTIGLR